MNTYSARKRQKVLVVGNEPAVVISLRTMLSVRALHVLATDSPDVAIHLAETMKSEIALALIDVSTLSMEPRALAERLRMERPSMKVLFFSSMVDGVVIRLGIIDPDGGVLQREGVVKAIEEALRVKTKPAKKRPKTFSAGSGFHYSAV